MKIHIHVDRDGASVVVRIGHLPAVVLGPSESLRYELTVDVEEDPEFGRRALRVFGEALQRQGDPQGEP